MLEQLSEIEDEKKEAEEEIRRLNGELKLLLVNGEKPRTEAQMKQYTKCVAQHCRSSEWARAWQTGILRRRPISTRR